MGTVWTHGRSGINAVCEATLGSEFRVQGLGFRFIFRVLSVSVRHHVLAALPASIPHGSMTTVKNAHPNFSKYSSLGFRV